MFKIDKDTKLSLKSILLNVLFIISFSAFFMLFYNGVSNLGVDDKIALVLRFVYLFLAIIIVSLFLFLFKKNIWQKIDLKKSKAVNCISVVIFLCLIAILLDFYSDLSILKVLLVAGSSFAVLIFSYALTNFVYYLILNFIKSMSSFEKKLAIGLLSFGVIFISFIFLFTTLFTHPSELYDAIFRFDNGNFGEKIPYFFQLNAENDARHVIMTICLLPFAIIPYLFSKIFSIIPGSFGLFMSYMQVFVVVYCIIKILHFLKIEDKIFKVLVSIAIILTSAFFINMLTVEKFIFAMFYIITTISLTQENSKCKWLMLALSIGCLTTNVFLAPIVLFYEKKSFKEYALETLKFCGLFLIIVFLSGQFNLLVFYKKSFDLIMRFAAGGYSFGERIMQYLIFIASLFVIPNGEANANMWIQSSPLSDPLMYVGIGILILMVVGLILNRKDKYGWICAYWNIFMFILLAVIGWGSAENEMFIYSAIFAWSSFSLVFMFFKSVIKNKIARICVLSAIILAIAVFNIIQFVKIMQFATEYYPFLTFKA